ncbi:MAG: hypothetical protein KIT11_06520 [Fimbriimonadaceae bacterium]|nr:hypothetical protein [Fimbriimonadaceae bacterium]QYK56010.1 MAG: hypothetical protein KF733_00710 [Fimbriimonadaceae bacterium]
MRYRLKHLLPWQKPKTPGFGISSSFYLSVLAARLPLPCLGAFINPKGEGGAVAGFGVPLAREAGKEAIDQPLERGVYGLSSPDRHSLLKMRVLSKEEAGFDPEALARSPLASHLPADDLDKIRATWSIVQLTFEAHDPSVYPALDFLTQCAARLADLTDGLIADPVCQVYRSPATWPTPRKEGEPPNVTDFIVVKHGEGFAHTLGLAKFAQPEIELAGFGPGLLDKVDLLLLSLANGVLRGQLLQAGDRFGTAGKQFRLAEGGLDRGRWDGIDVLEILPEQTGGLDEALAAFGNPD